MKKFLVADGGNPNGTAKDRDGTNPGTKYLSKYWNDNIFNLFEFVQSQGYSLIDEDLSQIAKASKSKYNANYTYNTSAIATQSVNDIVLGSDGKYYEAQANGINGDDPVGSVTGNWKEVLFDKSTLLKDFSKYASKTVPVNADLLVLSDSEDSNNNKKVSFENLKAEIGFIVASTAQAQAQTDDTTAISPLKLAEALQGTNQSLSENGYQKLPGGLIIQWGTVTVAASSSTAFTFPITFPNVALGIFSGRQSAAAGGGNVFGYSNASLTTSGTTAFNVDTTPATRREWYLAIGY